MCYLCFQEGHNKQEVHGLMVAKFINLSTWSSEKRCIIHGLDISHRYPSTSYRCASCMCKWRHFETYISIL